MKLYATITSERASEGQGGNKYLDIKVIDENRHDICIIRVENREDEIYVETSVNDETGDYLKNIYSVTKPKGKKAKREIV